MSRQGNSTPNHLYEYSENLNPSRADIDSEKKSVFSNHDADNMKDKLIEEL